jgi:hypothetical protein
MNSGVGGKHATQVKRSSLLNPWLWMVLALSLSGAAFAWARCTQDGYEPLDIAQLPIIFLGLVAAGVAVWLRCAFPNFASLDDLSGPRPGTMFFVLAAVHAVLAITMTCLVLVKYLAPASAVATNEGVGLVLFWVLTVPWCGYAAYRLFLRSKLQLPRQPGADTRFETAVLVTVAALVCFLASWALYWGPQASDAWDSMRLFLAALAAFAFLAAPLVAASSPVRRWAVSGLIVLHFTAILTTVIGSPPGPWIVGQVHHWIFRPYLTFMYLNNPYRFYSPEPGPANQLWFRIEYLQGKPHWGKIPDIDDQGRSAYPFSEQHTRRLALTENVSRTTPVPWTVPNAAGVTDIAAFVKLRDQHSPTPVDEDKLGFQKPVHSLKVPYHPDLPLVFNYQAPTSEGMMLLSSYARHLLSQPNPENAGDKAVSVKFYRVQHRIVPAEQLARGADPHDWTLYLPYYMGKYNAEGQLLDPHDPFLFWLLPIIRDDPQDPSSLLSLYFVKHAGDADWHRQAPAKMVSGRKGAE